MSDPELPEQAENGTPCAPVQWMQEHYPNLLEEIIEASRVGKGYNDGKYYWKLSKSDKYGDKVYQNESKYPKSSGSSPKPKLKEGQGQQQLKTGASDSAILELAAQIKFQNALEILELSHAGDESIEDLIKQIKEIIGLMG